MRIPPLFPVTLLLLAGVTPAIANPGKIDRTLDDEPIYQSRSPRYCLLVFGPKATTRIWLVLDGDVMHVHDSPDGKARKAWRQVRSAWRTFNIGDVHEESHIRHRNLRINLDNVEEMVSVRINGKDEQVAGLDRFGALQFTLSPNNAPIIHFNGPLTMDLFHFQAPLQSAKRVRLSAVVGTRGSGPGTFAQLNCDAYLNAGCPPAEVEFPAKKPGDKPITVRILLKED